MIPTKLCGLYTHPHKHTRNIRSRLSYILRLSIPTVAIFHDTRVCAFGFIFPRVSEVERSVLTIFLPATLFIPIPPSRFFRFLRVSRVSFSPVRSTILQRDLSTNVNRKHIFQFDGTIQILHPRPFVFRRSSLVFEHVFARIFRTLFNRIFVISISSGRPTSDTKLNCTKIKLQTH